MNDPVSPNAISNSPPNHSSTGHHKEQTVAVIGNPNTGKSTLFTALTGVHSRIGNYPGVTVEKKIGWFNQDGHRVRLVDLPGTYSLSPRSIDEMVSVDVLLGRQAEVGKIDAVVCIVDASNLERNLYLVSQVLDLGLPTVLVLNMWDVAQSRAIRIDTAELSRRLGISVVTCEAHRRKQVDQVRSAIVQTSLACGISSPDLFPLEFHQEAEKLRTELQQFTQQPLPDYLIERLLLDVGGQLEIEFSKQFPKAVPRQSDTSPRTFAHGRLPRPQYRSQGSLQLDSNTLEWRHDDSASATDLVDRHVGSMADS